MWVHIFIEAPQHLARLTGFHRNCSYIAGGHKPAGGRPMVHDEHYYLEPEDEAEAKRRGYKVAKDKYGTYMTLDEYIKRDDVKVIRADEIQPHERTGEVPAQGYVWAG